MNPNRSVLRRPLVATAALAAVVVATGAGYAATAPDAGTASAAATLDTLDVGTQRSLAEQDVAAATDGQFHQYAAARVEADRAASRTAVRVAVEAEAARLAEEARLAAEAEVARVAAEAEAARLAQIEAERAAAAEAASRDALRDPRGLARVLLADFGWDEGQFSCLDSLWEKESNWSPTADNPTSSAYGIPQALPGSKMSSAGPDWETNPATQIRWGLGYIEERYGSPCSAWSHSRANNWY